MFRRSVCLVATLCVVAAGLVFALGDHTPTAEAHDVTARRTTTKCSQVYTGYSLVEVCYPVTETYSVPHSHPTPTPKPKPTPTPTPKPKPRFNPFRGMTQAQICAAAGLPVNPSGTGCGSAPTPDPTPAPTPDPKPKPTYDGSGDGRGHDDDPGDPKPKPTYDGSGDGRGHDDDPDPTCPEGQSQHPATKGCYPDPCAEGTFSSADVKQDSTPSVYYGQVSKQWKRVPPGEELNTRAEGNLPRPAEWVQVSDTGCYALSFNSGGVGRGICVLADLAGIISGLGGMSAQALEKLKRVEKAKKLATALTPLGVLWAACSIGDWVDRARDLFSGDDNDDDDNSDDDNEEQAQPENTPAAAPAATPEPVTNADLSKASQDHASGKITRAELEAIKARYRCQLGIQRYC